MPKRKYVNEDSDYIPEHESDGDDSDCDSVKSTVKAVKTSLAPKKKKKKVPDEWCTYLLKLDHPTKFLTYVGSSKNFQHRLRQHNGEIKGGAKSTTRRSEGYLWKPICVMGGPAQTKRGSLQFEYRVKHAKLALEGKLLARNAKCNQAGRKLHPKVKAMISVACLHHWTKKMKADGVEASDIPMNLKWYNHDEKPHSDSETYLPDYITEIDC
jgi:predicted GIY-YIG superfamily endonuclease